jgi:sulfatase modifying factor 1
MIHVNLTPARGGPEAGRFDPCQPQIRIARRGGQRRLAFMRPQLLSSLPARCAQPVDISMSHVGFSCITREVG